MSSTTSIPIKFIDSLEEKQHIMLLYEDPQYARIIEFVFIKRGLERGEECIYATPDDTGSTVLMLQRYGIPLDAFLAKKIRVFQIKPSSGTHDEIVLNCKQEIQRILADVKIPFRSVLRIVTDVSTVNGISVEIEMEKLAQDCFEELGGTIMCPYDISEIEKTKKNAWIKSLYSNHHTIIYLPKYGEGWVFSPSQNLAKTTSDTRNKKRAS